ncbi:TolC family protein [Gemmatimonas sp.]|uniref:TolC family protein n=1 Tax=Gemmatimonas sp. TaxID=1962908 RepID=UPI0035677D3F
MNKFAAPRMVPTSALVALSTCLAMVAAPSSSAWAQAAPLDLAGALQQARQSGPLRKLADARELAGTGRVREAGQWPNPSIEWRRENLGSSLQPDIFATAYIPLDLTGRRLALRQASGAGRQRVRADAVAERRDAEIEVARAWLHAAAADGALAVASRQVEALTEIADVDATRLREGLVSGAVGLRTQLEADRARVSLVTATGDAARARAQLARAIGVSAQALPMLAVLAAPAMPAAPDSSTVKTIALRARPEVRARESALREAQRRYTAESRGLIGDMQLQGGSKQTGGFMTGQIGFAMPFPLFNRNDAARQRARGEYAEAQALRDDMLNQIQGSVSAAWRAYVTSREAAPAASTFDARGRQIARIARIAYREGHATLTELLDAERAATDAMNAHLRWASDAWLARLELERALGARLDDSSPLDLPVLSTLLTTGS